MTAGASAFAASESIMAGEWDKYLPHLEIAIRKRMRMRNPTIPPTEPLPKGQVWVWIFDDIQPEFDLSVRKTAPGKWEPRATGALITPAQEAEHRARRAAAGDGA